MSKLLDAFKKTLAIDDVVLSQNRGVNKQILINHNWGNMSLSLEDYTTKMTKTAADQFEKGQFVRQLVYNAVDADCDNINVNYERDNKTNTTTITFEDDGVGMDLGDIKNYLLCVFGSKHRGKKAKIGEFGLGLLSVFSEDVEKVKVETTMKNETYLVTLDPPKKGYLGDIVRKDESNEQDGTIITMELKESREAYQQRESLLLSELELCSTQVNPTINYQGKEVK
jgi:hypothetical protein